MEEGLLSELFFKTSNNKCKIVDCERVDISDDVKLYYRVLEGEQNGFEFNCVHFVSCSVRIEDWTQDPIATVERLVSGCAYWDGLRHMWFGDEEGYLHYIDAPLLVRVFEKLKELELSYCRERWWD